MLHFGENQLRRHEPFWEARNGQSWRNKMFYWRNSKVDIVTKNN